MSFSDIFEFTWAFVIGILFHESALHFLKLKINNTAVRRNTSFVVIAIAIILLGRTHQTTLIFFVLFLSFNLFHLVSKWANALQSEWLKKALSIITLFAISFLAVAALLILNQYNSSGGIHLLKRIIEQPDANGIVREFVIPGLIKRILEFTLVFPSAVLVTHLIIDFVKHRLQSKHQNNRFKSLSLEAQLNKAKLETIQAKMSPHFLYNSLNTIAGLAIIDGNRTREMATELSNYLRFNLNQNNDNLATVEEEIRSVKSYLKIEQIRFQEALDYNIQVSEEAKTASMPRFLLQPIVENAVKHGIKTESNQLNIEVNITLSDETLVISILDSGPAFSTGMSPGFGLKSVMEKLELMYPDKHELEFISEPIKMVRIRLETL